MNHPITIALAGNPNSGKTALFNRLTGRRQKVGNWPGVTVEHKTGRCVFSGSHIDVTDLPGIYSAIVSENDTAMDEWITCQYLTTETPDVIVNVIDGSHLERGLFLTLQLLAMRLPMIIAVNMLDVVQRRGLTLDLHLLSQQLGCPVVGVVANRGDGLNALKKAIIEIASTKTVSNFSMSLPNALSQAVRELDQRYPSWVSGRLLEGDHFCYQHLSGQEKAQLTELREKTAALLGEAIDVTFAKLRYQIANKITQSVITQKKIASKSRTEKIDNILINRYLGIPIFLIIMYALFVFSIDIGGLFQDFFDTVSSAVFIEGSRYFLTQAHVPGWLVALLSQGIGTGINTIITFIPVLGALFLFLGLLEDSGYMARAAFVMDRFMQWLGLPGKSFVPMIVGFGCNVPAVMGARTLSNSRDRILSIMMMPFMSCGARLAIFAVFASAFFPKHGALVIFSLYLTGILAAILTGLLLRKTVLKGRPSPLIMELPAYHRPHWNSVFSQSWHRLKSFIFRAGKVILPVCTLIGLLNSVTITGDFVQGGSEKSVLSTAGRFITPVFSPMGVHQDNWPATVGLVTGVLAKEVVIGTLNTLYTQTIPGSITKNTFDFRNQLQHAFQSIHRNFRTIGDAFKNPLLASAASDTMDKTAYGAMVHYFANSYAAWSYLLFILLYFPCISTMAAIRRELSHGWAYFSVLWNTGLAYSIAVISYQCCVFIKHPLSSSLWIAGLLSVLVLTILNLRVGNTVWAFTATDHCHKPKHCGSRCTLCPSNAKIT